MDTLFFSLSNPSKEKGESYAHLELEAGSFEGRRKRRKKEDRTLISFDLMAKETADTIDEGRKEQIRYIHINL